MRKVYFAFIVIITALNTNCSEIVEHDDASKITNPDCKIDTAFISRYLFYIKQVLGRRNTSSYQETFLSFRKLEALSTKNYNLDDITYSFDYDMHHPDTLNFKLNYWIDWLEENKCKFDSTTVSIIYENANEASKISKFDELFLEKERQLYGLDKYDDSQDSILIERVKNNMEENALKW